MSRPVSHDLHALIAVLTQAERRYVKMELRRHVFGETNQSELLFDALAGQKQYNEAQIKKRFAGYGFVKRLPEAKRELLDVILRAMRQFHAEKTPTRRIITSVTDALFLQRRGLETIAQRLLHDAIDEAVLIHSEALQAFALQSLVDLKRSMDEPAEPSTSASDDRLVRAAEHLRESAFMDGLLQRMETLVSRYGRSPDAAAKALAADIVREGEALHPLQSMSAQGTWLRMMSQKAFFIDGSPKTALQFDQTRLDILERDEKFRRANIHTWVNLIHSVALRLIVTDRIEAAIPLRDKLRNYWKHDSKLVSPKNRRAVAGQYLNIELLIAVQTIAGSEAIDERAVADSKQQMPMLKSLLAYHEADQLSETGMACLFNVGLLEFSAQRFREAVKQLNVIDNYPETMRRDIKGAAFYLRMLCHVELGHESVVTSLIRKRRRLSKDAPLTTDEELFLSFCLKAVATAPGSKSLKLLQETHQQLAGLMNDETEHFVTEMFGFRYWLRKKLMSRQR